MKIDNMGLSLTTVGRVSAGQRGVRAALTAVSAAALLTLTLFGTAFAPITPAFAQTEGGPAATALVAYKIGIDDQIEVTVDGHAEASRAYTVPSDGIIEPMMGGDINVLGMTVSQLRTRLTKAFAKRYYQPQVIVNVHPAVQTLNVTGVIKGGKMPFKQGEHVLDVISAAGGLPVPYPENFKATLFRVGSATPISIDLVKLYANDPSQNIEMFAGDTLYVEEKEAKETQVQVLGEVLKPGPVVLPRDASIVTVMQQVGGPTPLAALSRAFVERDSATIPIDLRNYRQTGFEPDVKLKAGDKIVIPTNKDEYYVTGGGGRTGTQTYPDDRKLTVYTAFTLAGGSTEGVDLHKVKLIHPLANNATQTTLVDVAQMLKTGDFSADKPVVPGDTVYIPPAASRRGLSAGEAIGLFSGIVGVLYTLTALRRH